IWRASRSGQKIERLPVDIPVQGVIDFNEDKAIARTLSLDVNNPHLLTPFQDWFIPETTITDASGQSTTRPWGLFIATPPKATLTAARYSGTIEGQDLTWLLSMDTVPEGTVIPAGTDTGAAAPAPALAGLDASQVALPDSGVLLTADYVPEFRASRLAVITDLYGTGARPHYKPWMGGDCVLRTIPYQDLASVKPRLVYRSQDRAITIVPPITSNPNWDRIRNRITVANIRPDHEPIFATVEVEDETSPVHPRNLGGDPSRPLWLSNTVYDSQVDTEEEARSKAQLLLSNAASWYRTLRIRTVLDQDAGAHDVVGLDVDHLGARYTGNWLRRAWTVRLQGVTATMDADVVRTERY